MFDLSKYGRVPCSLVYPLSADGEGIKMKPELMEKEKLYYIVFEEKILLVFKDAQDLLNCYEIEEKSLVQKAKMLSGADIEGLLEEYIKTSM